MGKLDLLRDFGVKVLHTLDVWRNGSDRRIPNSQPLEIKQTPDGLTWLISTSGDFDLQHPALDAFLRAQFKEHGTLFVTLNGYSIAIRDSIELESVLGAYSAGKAAIVSPAD